MHGKERRDRTLLIDFYFNLKKIFLFILGTRASFLYSALGEEGEEKFPRLITHLAEKYGGACAAILKMESPQEAFEAIREYSKFPLSSSTQHHTPIGKFYFLLFKREGGWCEIKKIGDTSCLEHPKEAPLIVKALHNAAVKFYKAGRRGWSTIEEEIDISGVAPHSREEDVTVFHHANLKVNEEGPYRFADPYDLKVRKMFEVLAEIGYKPSIEVLVE
jgi:hypothetical protein